MNDAIARCREMSDDELESSLRFLAEKERRNVTNLLAHLAETDRRKLHLKKGYPSLYVYCTKALRYDEGGAYRRIHASRVVTKYPDVMPLLEKGELNLTSLLLLSPILSAENHSAMFKEAAGKSKRELEAFVVAHAPRPALADHVARLPAAPPWVFVKPGAAPASPPSSEPAAAEFTGVIPSRPPLEWQAIVPITIERIRVGFDAGVLVMKLIDRARQILRHKYPEGRLEDIVRESLETLLDRKDPQRKLKLSAPPALVAEGPPEAPSPLPTRFLRAYAAGRYIAARVKSAVWARDQGRCAWRFEDGAVCGSRDFVEFDHIVPFAKGGRSEYRNIRLLCRAHNQLAAERAFPRPSEEGGAPAPARSPAGSSAPP